MKGTSLNLRATRPGKEAPLPLSSPRPGQVFSLHLTGAGLEQSKNHRDYEVGTTEERTPVSAAGWGKGSVLDRPRGEGEGCAGAGVGLWRPGRRDPAG